MRYRPTSNTHEAVCWRVELANKPDTNRCDAFRTRSSDARRHKSGQRLGEFDGLVGCREAKAIAGAGGQLGQVLLLVCGHRDDAPFANDQEG